MPGNKPRPLIDRLLERTDKTDSCWLWRGFRDQNGYGKIGVPTGRSGSAARLTHRVAYELFVGAIPPGMFVCHKCDNPPCLNPDHLFLGNHSDNMRDMIAKGRQGSPRRGKGEECGRSKLTEAEVIDIRRLKTSGCSYRGLAARFGVCKGTIEQIISRRTWTHI